MSLSREDPSEDSMRGLGLDRAMPMGGKVGRCEVDPTISGISAGRHCCGVGRPHGSGRADRGQESWIAPSDPFDDCCVGAAMPKPPERSNVRSLVRRQDPLRDAQVGQFLHLGETLERSLSRVGDRPRACFRGKIAVRQTGVVVGRADQTVEVRFRSSHPRPGGRCSGMSNSFISREATG